MLQAEQVTESIAHHGEGPIWDQRSRVVRWVDMLAGDILSLAEDAEVSSKHVANVVVAMRPRAAGGLVVGVDRGFGLIDADGDVRILPELWSDASVRMNDGTCDPQGRFYCGSMAYDERTGAGTLWRLDPDLQASLVLRDVTISNGMAWRPDGELAYYIDTPTQRVDALRFDPGTGELLERSTAFEVDPADGAPDGMTVDAEGGVWVALWGGGAVHRYEPGGALSEVVNVPAHQVSACTFGGPALDRLYITTSRQGLQPGVEPPAGALFLVTPGVRGTPAATFAG